MIYNFIFESTVTKVGVFLRLLSDSCRVVILLFLRLMEADMANEEDIKKLARSIWEAQGCPDGKHLEHYFRAKQLLEERERIQEHINRL